MSGDAAERGPYVEAAAIVAGVSAYKLDQLLASPKIMHLMRGSMLAAEWLEFDATRRAIRRAAREYEAAAAAGSAATPFEEAEPPLPHEISTYEAAVILGLTERRVRQLAAQGLGRRVAGRWLFDRVQVRAYAERRRLA